MSQNVMVVFCMEIATNWPIGDAAAARQRNVQSMQIECSSLSLKNITL
jgi:hypothetical protein